MIKNYKLLLIAFIFFASFININIFSEELEEKEAESKPGYINGKIDIRFSKYWHINMTYNDKIIEGAFNKRTPLNLPKNRYIVEVRIGDIMYKGSIYRKTPMFGKNSYEIDMLCYKTKFEGEITAFYKNVYKEHKIECIFGDSFFEGLITYGRKHDEANISINNEKYKISGFTVKRDKKNRIIDYKINDKKIFGTVAAIERTFDEYSIKTDGILTDDELFFFLFLEIFFKIDKKAEEESKKKTEEMKD